jgi:sugar phosphate isomerase/epimerase
VRTVIDLVACYWTVSGPVEIHYGREWSTFDWRDRCDQASRVGFTGLGLWHADIQHQLDGGRTLSEMQQTFAAAGLRHLELEFLADFFLAPGKPERAASDVTKTLLFEAASVFGAHHIKVGNIPGAVCDPDQLAEAFARLCSEASEHTDAKIAYEFMPFDVNVNTLDAALALLKDAGQPRNAGLVIDTWHMAKLGISPEDPVRVSSTSPATSMPSSPSGIPGRGVWRSSRRRCESCRSQKSSSGPMRRRARSSAPASPEEGME